MNSETRSLETLQSALSNAKKVVSAVSDAYHGPWENNPSTSVRAIFGHWLVKAWRHFRAIIILCEEQDLSMVAKVHYRQMFELFLQIRYFASFNQDEKEYLVEKIAAWGCRDYLIKLEPLKDHDDIKKGYDSVSEQFGHFHQNVTDEIRREKSKRNNYWFGSSFSKLAKDVSREGEDLKAIYQIISADIHEVSTFAIEVANPKPGVLDFRGYPDKPTLYKWATEQLEQATRLYANMWNDIAIVVGAPEIHL